MSDRFIVLAVSTALNALAWSVRSTFALFYVAILGELDSGDVEILLRLLQEEPVGASQLEQPAAVAMLADELHRAGKFTSQDALGAQVVRVPVGVPAGEIIPRVIFPRLEAASLGPAEPAFHAARDIAAVLAK